MDIPKEIDKCPFCLDKDIKHLQWLYERMKYVHNENENLDYMIRFREILEALRQSDVSENEVAGCDKCRNNKGFHIGNKYTCKECGSHIH